MVGLAGIVWVLPFGSCAQQERAKPRSPAELGLTAEVATTTDDGYPSTLRVTLKNVGGATVDMPMLAQGCSPDNGERLVVSWTSDDSSLDSGSGMSCGMSDQGSLMTRLKRDWIRLRPGESMTVTERIRGKYDETKRGTVHYQVEYDPPRATNADLAQVFSAGFVIPTEKLTTTEQSFRIR